MDYLPLYITAFLASLLTLFSGFGLGTILMPAFVFFFPVDVAIMLTAIVHFLNNLLKLMIFWRNASLRAVVHFGLPAVIAAVLGSKLLFALEMFPALAEYEILGKHAVVSPVKLVIGVVILAFVILENLPVFTRLTFPEKYLPVGGMISGFLGGLSGHQGALRSAFLIKCGLNKESFIATGVVIACLVDATRLTVYGAHLGSLQKIEGTASGVALLGSVIAAWAGIIVGTKFLKKMTITTVHRIVSVLLVLIGFCLAAGLI